MESITLAPEQLDSLVAPIALYPDPLLAQVLAASTYPLELYQAQQWLDRNKNLSGDALEAAVEKQSWDPSVQAMATVPEALKRMTEDIKWTTDLGNTFLAQQPDVMDAVQRLRAKAKESGKLSTNENQVVETRVVESKTIVVIQPASPNVVYVPTYSPTVIWGPPYYPYYPYPSLYYPPYYGGAWIGFGIGMAVGIGIAGGWGWGCGWGSNTININNNNNFVSHYNRQNNINGGRGNNNFQHRPEHRGGAPYGDRGTADKFGGGTRGQSLQAKHNRARSGGASSAIRGGSRASASPSNRDANRGGGRGSASPSTANRAGNFGGGGGDRIGNRQISSSGPRGNSAFSGSSAGGSRARANSSRGGSSFSGGRGGGSRGGGGGRRR